MEMTEPKEVVLQHILIQKAEEGECDGAERAQALFDQITADSSADFEALSKEHSEDPGTGTYRLLNNDVDGRTFSDLISELNARAAERDTFFREQVSTGQMPPEQAEKEMGAFVEELQEEAAKQTDLPYPRGTMVPAFGNVGFKLEVGEIGFAEYNEEESPFGWHIIKRTQ